MPLDQFFFRVIDHKEVGLMYFTPAIVVQDFWRYSQKDIRFLFEKK